MSEEVDTEMVEIHAPAEETEERKQFLEVRTDPGGERLVTTIEVLSLANKSHSSHGRAPYVQKQREVLGSPVNLVEIDWLRGGTHTTAVPLASLRARGVTSDYHVCVHRFDRPDDYLVYLIRLPRRLPTIEVPLLPGTPAVRVDLQALLDRCYDVGLYARRANYREPPVPPLRPEQAEWANQILRAKGLAETPPVS